MAILGGLPTGGAVQAQAPRRALVLYMNGIRLAIILPDSRLRRRDQRHGGHVLPYDAQPFRILSGRRGQRAGRARCIS